MSERLEESGWKLYASRERERWLRNEERERGWSVSGGAGAGGR
jgi:hypothetical protein